MRVNSAAMSSGPSMRRELNVIKLISPSGRGASSRAGPCQQVLPVARQIYAPARARAVHVIAHVAARLVASGIAGNDETDILRSHHHPDLAIGIARFGVVRRQDADL